MHHVHVTTFKESSKLQIQESIPCAYNTSYKKLATQIANKTQDFIAICTLVQIIVLWEKVWVTQISDNFAFWMEQWKMAMRTVNFKVLLTMIACPLVWHIIILVPKIHPCV